jgi:hypothetical protein
MLSADCDDVQKSFCLSIPPCPAYSLSANGLFVDHNDAKHLVPFSATAPWMSVSSALVFAKNLV